MFPDNIVLTFDFNFYEPSTLERILIFFPVKINRYIDILFEVPNAKFHGAINKKNNK